LKPHLRLQWCLGQITAEFLARLEQVLQLYRQAYHAAYPVVCFDERACQLLDQVADPVPMQPGKPLKEDNEYERKGTCSLLVAFEPITGQRIVETSPTRKGEDYSRFMQNLAKAYPQAVKIRLVQDNLNTHSPSSFYQHLPAQQALQLTNRFEWIYTPKKASWLNMVELELSALSRICLNRRIPSMTQLDEQIQYLVKERNQVQASVNWQFSIESARTKLKRHYQKINSNN
jgi:hypothetical protein